MVFYPCFGRQASSLRRSPVFPNAGILWQLVKDHRVAVFGLSPKYLSLCIEQEALLPKDKTPARPLRLILSTGSPLLAHHYDWIFNWFSGEVPISSISGGTDIVSCFLLACPLLPIYKGELQAPGLGMAVDVWDSEHAAACPQGTTGELVCTQPFVAMPLQFLNDAHNQKFKSTYFERYRSVQVWHHGDFAKKTARGGFVILGRSDATLNPGGVRIGTAEIYRLFEETTGIKDSLVFWYKPKRGGEDSSPPYFSRKNTP